jgi:hypothetical protein
LWDTENWQFLYNNFQDYSTISRTGKEQILNPDLYQTMHVNSVGSAVLSSTNDTIVHKRLSTAPTIPDSYDCSAAGFAYANEKGELDYLANIQKALKRELEITKEDIRDLKVSSIHSSRYPDYSGMCDFVVKTNLSTKDLKDRAKEGIKRGVFQDYEIVSQRDLPCFITDNFSEGVEVCLDGCATLMSSLPYGEFQELTERLRQNGRRIEPGKLVNGQFQQEINNSAVLN